MRVSDYTQCFIGKYINRLLCKDRKNVLEYSYALVIFKLRYVKVTMVLHCLK